MSPGVPSTSMTETRPFHFSLIFSLVLLTFSLIPACIADLSDISAGGTIFVGEQDLDISATGIQAGDSVAWWAPGSQISGVPSDIERISDPKQFSASSAAYSGKEGTWYKYPGNTPVFQIKTPSLRVGISDTTSDFDATGKWLPKGHIASFQVYTNLYEMRSRGGGGAAITIRITGPDGAEYTSVSGPTGMVSLSDIPVGSSPFDTGGVWNTAGFTAGTYRIQAECTANRLKDRSDTPGTGISVPVTVQIQDVNPLIKTLAPTPNISQKLEKTQMIASPEPVRSPVITATPTPVSTVVPTSSVSSPVPVPSMVSISPVSSPVQETISPPPTQTTRKSPAPLPITGLIIIGISLVIIRRIG